MSGWLTWLVRGRSFEIACAIALGYALARLAEDLAEIPLAALAQHVSDDLDDFGLFEVSIYYLRFHVGSTVIAYGPLLASTIAFAVTATIAWAVIRRRDRELGECPFCASRIPYESTHCAYCGSGVAPGEP